MESPEPSNVNVKFVALGLKNMPLTPPWLNVKSGATPPGSDPKPVVAMRSDPGVLVDRLLGNVNVLILPSLFALRVNPLVAVSPLKLSNISTNCTLPSELLKTSFTCQK
jgi:hypothetical protein